MALPGQRQSKSPSTKDEIRALKKMLENVQMANRVLQMGMQQLSQSFQKIDGDISRTMGVVNNLEYRTLSMIEVGSFDRELLDAEADKLKVVDYNKASDEEDKLKGLINADVIEADSIVILTSVCTSDPERSIFRSRFKLSESGNVEAIEALPGKKVGDKVDIRVNNDVHTLEILGIRKEAETTSPTVAEPILTDESN